LFSYYASVNQYGFVQVHYKPQTSFYYLSSQMILNLEK